MILYPNRFSFECAPALKFEYLREENPLISQPHADSEINIQQLFATHDEISNPVARRCRASTEVSFHEKLLDLLDKFPDVVSPNLGLTTLLTYEIELVVSKRDIAFLGYDWILF